MKAPRAIGHALVPIVLLGAVAVPGPAAGGETANAGSPPSALAPHTFRGRGVYYFEGSVESLLAGVGSRSARATNRLALDDEHSEVTVDRANHRIVLRNDHRYGLNQLVGCLLFLGVGTTRSNEQVPVGVHLKIRKTGNRFWSRLHPHPTVRDEIVTAKFEPFEVVLANGTSEQVVLTPEQSLEALREPELTARLANIFLQVTDHLEHATIRPEEPGTPLVDLSIGFGAKKLKLDVARIRLVSKAAGNAPLIRRGDLGGMFGRGEWEFRIEAESPLIPRDEFARQFFLFGLDDLAVLAPLERRGLRRGEALVVGFQDGRGYIGLDEDRTEIENPADVARAYLEFHFVGGVVARQVSRLPQRIR